MQKALDRRMLEMHTEWEDADCGSPGYKRIVVSDLFMGMRFSQLLDGIFRVDSHRRFSERR